MELPEVVERVRREEPLDLSWQSSNRNLSSNSMERTSDTTMDDLLSQTPTTLKWTPCQFQPNVSAQLSAHKKYRILTMEKKTHFEKNGVKFENGGWMKRITSLAWRDREETMWWRSWRPTPPQPIKTTGIVLIFFFFFFFGTTFVAGCFWVSKAKQGKNWKRRIIFQLYS